jgi:non-specific serine/threonine protein kinase
LRLGSALWWVWYLRGEFREGQHWLTALLALDAMGDPAARAGCLLGAGACAYQLGDLPLASELAERGLALSRATDGTPRLDIALNLQGVLAAGRGDYADAQRHFEEALALYRSARGQSDISSAQLFAGSLALANLGTIALERGDFGVARSYYEESLSLARQLADHQALAHASLRLGETVLAMGDRARAKGLVDEAATLFAALGDGWGMARAHYTAARLMIAAGTLGEAAKRLEAGARFCLDAGITLGLVFAFELGAQLAERQGQYVRAAAFLGGAAALRAKSGVARTFVERREIEHLTQWARKALTPAMFDSTWHAGENRTVADLVAELNPDAPAPTPQSRAPLAPTNTVRLTRREQELLPYLARGMSNRAIAAHLSISARTVEMHIANLLGKLALSNRAQIAAWAAQHGFVNEADVCA